jgi:hypothetical protein
LRPDVAILINAAPPSLSINATSPLLSTQYIALARVSELLELNPEEGELIAFGPDFGRFNEPSNAATPILATLADPEGHHQAMK